MGIGAGAVEKAAPAAHDCERPVTAAPSWTTTTASRAHPPVEGGGQETEKNVANKIARVWFPVVLHCNV